MQCVEMGNLMLGRCVMEEKDAKHAVAIVLIIIFQPLLSLLHAHVSVFSFPFLSFSLFFFRLFFINLSFTRFFL